MSVNITQCRLVVFLDGALVPFDQARLPIYDLGIVQGATVTERLRTVRHRPYLVAEHLARLERSLATVGWNLPGEVGPMEQAIHDVVRHNTQDLDPEMDLSVVVFVTAGQALGDANGHVPRSCPTVCVYTAPLPLTSWAPAYRNGLRLATPEVRQLPTTVLSPHLKHRSRLHWHVADRQSRQEDSSAHALLLNESGHVTETSTGNLFIVRRGTIATPEDDAVLLGIARSHVIGLAEARGWTVERRPLTPFEVQSADEAFLTSSTYCILPVSHLNGTRIGSAIPGPVTKMLIDAWGEEIGLDFERQALDAR